MTEKIVHICMQEKLLREMHGDLRSLLSEFKAMNGDLRNTKSRFDIHDDESKLFRSQVTTLWAVVHGAKWVITLMLGTGGLLWIMLHHLTK